MINHISYVKKQTQKSLITYLSLQFVTWQSQYSNQYLSCSHRLCFFLSHVNNQERKELFYQWWESFLNIHIYQIMPSSVNQSSPTLCDPMDCSMSGFPVHHQLLELAQTHVHRVGDAIQPSHPVIPFSCCLQSFPVSGSFPMSQFFASGSQSTGASTLASVLPMSIQD